MDEYTIYLLQYKGSRDKRWGTYSEHDTDTEARQQLIEKEFMLLPKSIAQEWRIMRRTIKDEVLNAPEAS